MPTAREVPEAGQAPVHGMPRAPRLYQTMAEAVCNAVLDTFWRYPNERLATLRAGLKLALRPLRELVVPLPFPSPLPVLWTSVAAAASACLN